MTEKNKDLSSLSKEEEKKKHIQRQRQIFFHGRVEVDSNSAACSRHVVFFYRRVTNERNTGAAFMLVRGVEQRSFPQLCCSDILVTCHLGVGGGVGVY